MADDHEIEVLNGLIATMTARAALVNSSPDYESVGARQRRVLISRVQGLGAQIVALGGVWKVAAIDTVDMATLAYKPPDRDEAGAAAQAGAAMAAAFRTALDDRQIGASTRAAINTAWSFLEAEFNDATLIKTPR